MTIPQKVTDISDTDQLLRYAAAGQLAHLLQERKFLNNGLVGQGAEFAKTQKGAGEELSRALRNGFSPKQLIGLDEIFGALRRTLDGTGGLSSLALRLSMEQRDKIDISRLVAHLPPSWTSSLLQHPPADEIEALTQASAVLAAFQTTGKMNTKGLSEDAVRDRYSEDLKKLVRRLVAVSGAPPTARNYDAQVLLGLLASYSFDSMKELLEGELKYSPLGYRVWRAITKLVTLSDLHGSRADKLRVWVSGLLEGSEQLRDRSMYAGRALDMELAVAVPEAWSPPGEDDWVHPALAAKGRERGRDDPGTRRSSHGTVGTRGPHWPPAHHGAGQERPGPTDHGVQPSPGTAVGQPRWPPLDSCHAWGGHRVREASVQRLAASGRPLVPACQACGPRAGPSGHP